jgi:hypothetical protein
MSEPDWSQLEKLNYDWDYLVHAYELYSQREGIEKKKRGERKYPCMRDLYNYLKMVYKGGKTLEFLRFNEDLHFLNVVSWKQMLRKPKRMDSKVMRWEVHLEDCVFWGKARSLSSKVDKVVKETFED